MSVFPTTGLLDDFNRVDANPISGNWAQHVRIGNRLKIISNQVATGTAGTSCSDYFSLADYGPDSEIFVTVAALPVNVTERLELFLRLDNEAAAASTGYRLRIAKAASNYDWTLYWMDATSGTNLIASATNIALAVGNKIGFEAISSALNAYLWNGTSWSSKLSGTDTHYSTVGRLSIGLNGDAWRIDDFSGGTVVSAAVTANRLAALGVG
jgi:hypothetical protein